MEKHSTKQTEKVMKTHLTAYVRLALAALVASLMACGPGAPDSLDQSTEALSDSEATPTVKPPLPDPTDEPVPLEPTSDGQAGDDISIETILYSYTATNTNSALQNTVRRRISLNAGQRIVIGTCGLKGSSFSGDTVLRLYGPTGAQVAVNDDACGGLGSRILYTATATGTYEIHAGCFASGTCSGTVSVGLGVFQSSYSATNTSSATINFRTFYTFANAGDRLVIGTCDLPGASFSGDTYLRLFRCNSTTQVAFNDDGLGFNGSCGLGSKMTYDVPSDGCFEVRAGCFGSGSCSGSLVIVRE
jgi:hypothetical protein